MFVDPDGAGFEPGGDLAGGGKVGGPDWGAESDVERVGSFHGFVHGALADDGQGGAELFLGHERVVVVDVRYEGGGVEVAGLLGYASPLPQSLCC